MRSSLASPALTDRIGRVAGRVGNEAYYLGWCVRSGMLGVASPLRVAQGAKAFLDYGMLGGVSMVPTTLHPKRTAIVDDRGEITYRELNDRANAIASAWLAAGLKAGDGVAMLMRNHRDFFAAVFAAARCGARVILVNTGFSGPQVHEVAAREGVDMIVYDEEFEPVVKGLELRFGGYRAWLDSRFHDHDTLDYLVATSEPKAPPKPARPPRLVILTSGTTGTPKGAGRDVPVSLSPVGGPLSKVPFHAGDVSMVSAPLFHALGFSQGIMQMALSGTLVLQRRFTPAGALDTLAARHVNSWVVVPVMLQRVLALEPSHWQDHDISALRVIYLSGSQLGIGLAHRAMARFGPVLYNLYGSTEIAFATIATPDDLKAEPGCVGQVVRGAVVKIMDRAGKELPVGETGRIFVGHLLEFEGYTGGGDKERIGHLVSSGDMGHFDANARLFIDGRDDEMIISGGENVFPREIEELLQLSPDIMEAAVVGVPDEQFGQRLVAFVVPVDGAQLTEEEIKDRVRQNLARYKVPRDVVFLDELPRNPTGKVLKRELIHQS